MQQPLLKAKRAGKVKVKVKASLRADSEGSGAVIHRQSDLESELAELAKLEAPNNKAKQRARRIQYLLNLMHAKPKPKPKPKPKANKAEAEARFAKQAAKREAARKRAQEAADQARARARAGLIGFAG